MSSKFHAESHLKKMHDALKKEYLLHCLLQPRQQLQELEGEEGGGGEEGVEEEEEGDVLKRAQSAPEEVEVEEAAPPTGVMASLFRWGLGPALRWVDKSRRTQLLLAMAARIMTWPRATPARTPSC